LRVLFIGPYRQPDGWGNAAKEYIKALSKVEGIELSIRPIYMGSSYSDLEEELLEYEFNDHREYDVVIQNVLPHLSDYNGSFKKNILLFYTESNNIDFTSWPSRANLMDEIWVPSTQEKNNLQNSGVTSEIKTIPIPINVDKFNGEIGKLSIPTINEQTFTFYTSAEFVQRKNLSALVAAFHSEFDREEDVALLIKTGKSGMNNAQVTQHVGDKFTGVKSRLRIYPSTKYYKNEIIVSEHLSEANLLALYNSCDCFVMPSHGESWCIPAIESMGLGNPCIVTSQTGMTEFVNENNGWVVDSQETIAMVKDAPLPDLYTARETWRQISTPKLKEAMREAFENKDSFKNKSEQAKEKVKEYSYEKVSEIMKESLNVAS